ncbi:MAG: Npt1/Npt2 family nucleotide transporter [Chlamydiia bacterium]
MFKAIREEFQNYRGFEFSFIIFAMISSFLITGEASITKPVAHSLFMEAFGVPFFPYVWIAVIPASFLVVTIYNILVAKIGCFRMLFLTVFAGAIINLTTVSYVHDFVSWPFFFYIWKDIYIMLMFQQLWSVINSTIQLSKARYLYGLFFGFGGLGSLLASLIPGLLAIRVGTEKLLYFSLPFYLLLLCAYYFLMRARKKIENVESITFAQNRFSDFFEGMSLIKNSSLLRFILLIVVAMQAASTLIDYEFNIYVSNWLTTTNERTAYFGWFFGVVNIMNVTLQLFGSFFLIELIGLKRCHIGIPGFIASALLAFLLFPSFGLIAFAYGSIKALDYSIFGVVKEMLYIPLSIDQKFKAKAVIDVFLYRSAKAIASLAILILPLVWIDYVSLSIFILWITAVLVRFRPVPVS